MAALLSIYLLTYLPIYRVYIVPLQGNYSEALPAQARSKRRVLGSIKVTKRSHGGERRSEGRLFQTEGPTIKKALFCQVVVRASYNTKSPLEVERRDRRPEQAEVKIRSP